MSDTNGTTNATETLASTTDVVATSNETRAAENVVSKKEYDTIAGKYGSALQRIKQLEESLLEVDKIKSVLNDKEKEIQQLAVYRDRHINNVKMQWQNIKPQITDEIKEFFPNPDTDNVSEIEQYVEKWQEIDKIKAALNKQVKENKPVPPLPKTSNSKMIISNSVSNWRIG